MSCDNGFGIGWFILIVMFCGRGCGTMDLDDDSLEEIKNIKCGTSEKKADFNMYNNKFNKGIE